MTPEPDADLDVQPTPDAAPGDEVEALLSQYDQEQAGKPAEPTPETPQPETLPEPTLDDFVPKTVNDLKLRNELLGLREDILRHAEQHDLNAVLQQAHREIPEIDQLGLPDSFIEGWLARQYNSDPKLQRDWDARGRDPDAAMRRIGKTLGALQRELKAMPDPKATADRASVTAALKGMADPAAAREVDWSSVRMMSDVAFDRFARSLEKK